MRVGIVILPQFDWPEAARYWRGAEERGFDHAWTYDHLSWRSLAGERWHATIPTLTAAAMVTERIRLGTFVASPNYRHPVPFAKDVATLDQVSGGRVLLGLGSGGTGFDAHVMGQPELTPRERVDRFADFTATLDELLRFEGEQGEGQADASGGISHDGPWYTAREARMVGEPAQRPRMPFIMAANGPRALRIAVQHGQGWVTTGPYVGAGDAEWWRAVGDLSVRLDDACEAAGRDPRSIERHLSLDRDESYAMRSVDAFEEAVGLARERGFTDVITHWPRTSGIHTGDERVLDEVASRLDAIRAD
ncbi:luciferase [Agromyces rhizosphaerae]|uniref:Luciferase n=1 Tax=Agromyces rhizosphaerae TaxID=88374 RepID=A0A9W6CT56_9MICO|nr:LLM class flavin-dependent oxidoreductase [Agromyces rhizosphaerae]GLI25857.1 luciferase [Agromyces rhizosphaerae]